MVKSGHEGHSGDALTSPCHRLPWAAFLCKTELKALLGSRLRPVSQVSSSYSLDTYAFDVLTLKNVFIVFPKSKLTGGSAFDLAKLVLMAPSYCFWDGLGASPWLGGHSPNS